MHRVAPSERLKQELQQFLSPGVRPATDDPAGQLVRLAARLVLQEALEGEQADFLGRDRYERGEGALRGYRNGYAPGQLKSAEGALSVALPQVRGSEQPFRSPVLSLLGEQTQVLERLAVEMYARGLSTRDDTGVKIGRVQP
jgi:transposase-like protein